jgi:hypothetical protein
MKALISALFILIGTSANALSNADFLDRLSTEEQTAFLQGAVEAVSHLYYLQGDEEQAQCIDEWWTNDEIREDRIIAIDNSMEKRRDLTPTTIILGYIKQHCGRL